MKDQTGAMRRHRDGVVNVLLLITVLISNQLYATEIGGEESVWNSIGFLAAFVFVLRNQRRSFFATVFVIPVFLILVGGAINGSVLHMGAFRSMLATAVGLALFALPPVNLNRRLLKRLILLFVAIALALSVGILVSDPLAAIEGNRNFNVNQNSAAQMFYICAVLSLLFLDSRVKWLAVALCAILLVTTHARTGSAAFLLTVVGYALLVNRKRLPRLSTILVRSARVIPAAVLGMYALKALFPVHVSALVSRFETVRDYEALSRSRFSIWDTGIKLWLESPLTVLFGHGPGTVDSLIGVTAHSSYVEALVSYGMLFVLTSLLALLLWTKSLVRRGHYEIIVVVFPLLFYGATQNFLFSGLSMLWFFLAFVGIHLQARPSELPAGASVKSNYRRPATTPPLKLGSQ